MRNADKCVSISSPGKRKEKWTGAGISAYISELEIKLNFFIGTFFPCIRFISFATHMHMSSQEGGFGRPKQSAAINDKLRGNKAQSKRRTHTKRETESGGWEIPQLGWRKNSLKAGQKTS